MGPSASVIVRTRDSASTLGAALSGLCAQSVPVEIVLVDSGSSDATLSIAEGVVDAVVTLAAEEFTFGRALNAGADAATAPVHLALSSHVVPPDDRWVERALAHHEDPSVVATTGHAADPDTGAPLEAPVRQDLAHARAHPRWGMSCTGASWRADVFADHRFDETYEASEDKEWALRALAGGGVLMVDPLLAVGSTHRKALGWPAYLQRVRREDRALLRMGLLEDAGSLGVVKQWFDACRTAPQGQRGFTSLTRGADALAMVAAQRDGRHGSAWRQG